MSCRAGKPPIASAVRVPHSRAAFSLVEMMIATIILGFGLLMIGAVLPIAWQGSLDASAYTRAAGVYRTAKFYVQRKCRVDGMRDLFQDDVNTPHSPYLPPDGQPDWNDNASYSFLGDVDTLDFVDGDTNGFPDLAIDGLEAVSPVVHALHMENWAVDPASSFLLAGLPANSPELRVPEAPILSAYSPPSLSFDPPRRVGMPADISLVGYPTGVGAPVIRLGERLYPALPASVTPQDESWGELLDQRRFAWAVFHKLSAVPEARTDLRQFLVYYVTLRRGNSTSRFARQDPTTAPLVRTTNIGSAVAALADQDDVRFPIAWRVPLLMLESRRGTQAIAFAGVEEEDLGAEVMPASLVPPMAQSSPLYPVNNNICRIAQMFPRGSVFIDEENGNVYRVTQREYVPDGSSNANLDELARLTLDRDVRASELVSNPAAELVDPDDPNSALTSSGAERRNRVVWVFPPAAAPGRDAPGQAVSFTGANPVVDLRVEPLTLVP